MAGGKLARSEYPLVRESFWRDLLRRIKRAQRNGFIERNGARVRELLVLRWIHQRSVRFQKPVDQLPFLILRERGGDDCEQNSDYDDRPHVCERAELSAPL
jgi:hypothetical protein